MAENSKIEWTDATVNFWWGCTKVGPGCDHCYAETFDKRTGGKHWGFDHPRRKIASAVKLIHKLDNQYSDWAADAECSRGNARVFGLPVPLIGNRRRVFIQSMSDLFDLEVPVAWFEEAWGRIESCDRIDVQIVTKRISAVEKRLASIGRTVWPKHVGLMVTVVNQEEAHRDVPRLLELKGLFSIPWAGLSVEPMLGPMDLRQWMHDWGCNCGYGGNQTLDHCPNCGWVGEGQTVKFEGGGDAPGDCPECKAPLSDYYACPVCKGTADGSGFGPNSVWIDWVICGGESGGKARPMDIAWAEGLQRQCAKAEVAFFMKQIDKKTPIPDHLMTRQFPAALGGAGGAP